VSRGFLPLLALVLAAGVAAFAWATEGFRVVTAEGARRLAVERAPRPVPDVRLTDQDGRGFSFADYRGRTLLVDFIYTSCPTICGVLGDDFRGALAQRRNSAVDLLSISFDPEHDDREALRLYGERYGASAPRWRIAAPADERELARLLRAFGVVVIADGLGGFVHDAALYLVDPRGRLARILDPGALPPPAARLP
jgi:protein SCO1/2